MRGLLIRFVCAAYGINAQFQSSFVSGFCGEILIHFIAAVTLKLVALIDFELEANSRADLDSFLAPKAF